MTVQEMHIGVDQILQKVNSNFTRTFKPQEKDWALNEEVLRFIKQRLSPRSNDKKLGFQANEKRYEDLENLITPDTLPVYVKDNFSVFTYLPVDFVYLVSDRSYTKDLCGAVYNPATVVTTIYYTALKLTDDEGKFADFDLQLNGTSIFTNTTALGSASQYFELINQIIPILNGQDDSLDISAKFEDYLDMFIANSIIVASTIPFTLSAFYGDIEVPCTISTKTYTKVNVSWNSNIYSENEHRLIEGETIHTLRKSNFGGTDWKSPLSTKQGTRLNVWHDKKFIIESIEIDYIRKPKQISLSLNQGCELSPNVHGEIVENTAKRLAGLTLSQAYPNIINENLLKE